MVKAPCTLWQLLQLASTVRPLDSVTLDILWQSQIHYKMEVLVELNVTMRSAINAVSLVLFHFILHSICSILPLT